MGKTLHDREAKKDAAYFRQLRHSRELRINLEEDTFMYKPKKSKRREDVPETSLD